MTVILGWNNKSWSLGRNALYSFQHNGVSTEISVPPPQNRGVSGSRGRNSVLLQRL
uniref:Uncharacterized protein n=1 Tax=Anguilla anguilla TaxID=7936 RepID=A0A0E9RR43_ANGAN